MEDSTDFLFKYLLELERIERVKQKLKFLDRKSVV